MATAAQALRPELILQWLQKEMDYPLPLPSADQLRKICRGNMVPVWSFLLRRVRSERTAAVARRNILVHGAAARRGRSGSSASGGAEEAVKEAEAKERDAAAEEVERLRGLVRRQRKELRARMSEAVVEENERQRVIDERSDARHKQTMLEAYDQQSDEACKIFAEYQRRLRRLVDQARQIQRLSTSSAAEDIQSQIQREIYSASKGAQPSDETFILEMSFERTIRRACENLAAEMLDRIRNMFPAFEGIGVHVSSQSDASKLGIELESGIPDDVKVLVMELLNNPSLLLRSMISYASQVKTLIQKETEKIDIAADAELLRYKYENDQVIDAASADAGSPLPYRDNGRARSDLSISGTSDQLLERQKAHVQQFLATEDALNKAAEAKSSFQKLLQRLHGSADLVTLKKAPSGMSLQNVSNNRHLELDVWAKEREVAGLRACLATLDLEMKRLNKLCADWKEAEDSLKKKWKKIEQFDARRTELECIYNALLQANLDASSFWEQQPSNARDFASTTIVPACASVVETASNAKDLLERERSAYGQSLINRSYMLPVTSQAILEAFGATGAPGSEAAGASERHVTMLTAKAGARDPSAVPSICRISAALKHDPTTEASDSGLVSILKSLEFCMKPCGSEANVLEDLFKAANLIHTRRYLVENDRIFLNNAGRKQQEYERMASYCSKVAAEQERVVIERWLLDLTNAIGDAQSCLVDCQRVRALVDEWWDQPAATAVDWVTVDGQNVGAWLNLVKQLQETLYD